MDEPRSQSAIDSYHLRLLGIFHYILGAISALSLIYNLTVGVLMQKKAEAMQASMMSTSGNPFPMEAFQHLGEDIAFFMNVWGTISMILNPLAGLCLQKTWGRALVLVISAFNCLNLPLGTVLAVFTIIVLMRLSVRERFANPAA